MPKQDLAFSRPYLNTAGSLGFYPDRHADVDWATFGAFITNPISLRQRRPTEMPAFIEYPGGVLIHSGLPNPGLRRALQQYSLAWAQSPLPIIVSLMADRPDETREMVRALESQENLLAIELGFAPLLADDLMLLSVEMSVSELPIIVSLPADKVLRLGPKVEAMGAAATSLAPPRGTVKSENQWISGRLFGPSLLPQSLDLVRGACKLGLTVIASTGVASRQGAESMLAAGALAVEYDINLWIPSKIEKSPVK